MADLGHETSGEAYHFESLLELIEAMRVVYTLPTYSTLEIPVLLHIMELEMCSLFPLHSSDEVVEYVEIPLSGPRGLTNP